MPTRTPRADFDSRYSDPQASATAWQDAREVLATTELVVAHHGPARWTPAQHSVDHCLVRRRCPLLYRTGGTQAQEPRCQPVRRAGGRPERLADGLDVVLEGEAIRVLNREELADLAEAWVAKYGEEWRFDVAADGFRHSSDEGVAEWFGSSQERRSRSARTPAGQTAFRFG